MAGWIKLYRKVMDEEWLEEKFTRGQAWIDLLMLANFEKREFWVRGNQVVVERGQLGYSMVKLASRWGWGAERVKKFLNDLKKRGQIEYQTSSVTTLITILNYEEYQGDHRADHGADRRADRRADRGHNKKERKKEEKKGHSVENKKTDWETIAEEIPTRDMIRTEE